MAFLMKIAELQKNLKKTLTTAEEAKDLLKKEGIGQNDLNEKLLKASQVLKQAEDEINDYLKDKQSTIEEIEFLSEAFHLEYGTILNYWKYASLIENKEVALHLVKFGKMETKHANELLKLIHKKGGTPHFSFKEKEAKEKLKKEDVLQTLIEDEKKTMEFYEDGLSRFRDAEFAWLIGNIKLDETEHLKELEKLGKEFKDKEICVPYDPDFKWIDPYMGEPGDRAWIE